MIFVILGSRDYQFNRLLKEVDKLIEERVIDEPVFAQIGPSDYIPKNYQYEKYLAKDEFDNKQKEAELIISHGGTGALVSALKLGKQVIAVPRLAKFNEHIDNHQLQVTGALEKEGYLLSVPEMDSLGATINSLKTNPINKPYKKESRIKEMIITFIEANR